MKLSTPHQVTFITESFHRSNMKIAIIGKGHVGGALAKGFTKAGHEIKFGHRDPKEPVKAAASWGEVIILAVPYGEAKNAAAAIGSAADGKPLIDVMNPLSQSGLAVGFTTSAGEETQILLPRARVVKAFNTVFAVNMPTGSVGREKLTAFLAGDDAGAKEIVAKLASDIGFEPLDCGPIRSARFLEPMTALLIHLAFEQGKGTGMGFKLVKA
jgi:predicted dinucleotide-binding enzyme